MTSRDQSYWESSIGLTPSAARNTPPAQADILIIGAGFCGSWLAYFLKRQSPTRSVVIIERDYMNWGASTRNAGFLSCGNVSEWYEDFLGLGWDETMRTLDARIGGIEIIKNELAGRVAIDRCGSYDYDELTEEKVRFMGRMNDYLLGSGRRPFFSVEEVQWGGQRQPAILNRFDGAINPAETLQALHRALADAGVDIHWQTTATAVGAGTAMINSSAGAESTIKYGHAFVCTNAFARQFNAKTSVAPARGQIIVTSPCQTTTQRGLGFLRSGYDYFRFIGDRVLVGGGRLAFKAEEDTDALVPTQNLKSYLTDLAQSVIGHADFTVEHHWAGIMGMRGGGHASISDMTVPQFLDERTQEVAGCGGWGVTLMPFLAQHLARESGA